MNLLLIAHQSTGADLLAQRLGGAGFRPELVKSAEAAAASRLRDSAASLLLDLGPDAPPAASLIALLRGAGLHQPLLVLSARDDWRERVSSFDAGADDFLVKPAHSEEVAARLRAVIRRAIGAGSDRIVSGELDVDLKGQCAWLAGRCLDLTRNEFRLLRLLLLAPAGQVSKAEIAASVWPEQCEPRGNAIEVLVGRLRAKLGPERIRTVRGVGYRLGDPEPAEAPLATRSNCSAPS